MSGCVLSDFYVHKACDSNSCKKVLTHRSLEQASHMKKLGKNVSDVDLSLPCYSNSEHSSLVIQPGGALSMILSAAGKQKGIWQYDDIIPFLREECDWIPKTSTLERYVRLLCKHGLLIRVKKGVYTKR